jgi:hypothetical protein
MNRLVRLATATALASAAIIVGAQPASALDLPGAPDPFAGCAFPLRLEPITGDPDKGGFPPVRRELKDQNGNTVFLQLAGKNGGVVYTNIDTNEALSFRPRGTAIKQTTDSNGSTTWVVTGHFGLTFFSTDNPPGPSTIFYDGRVVFVDNPGDAADVFIESSGKKTDVCAELAP